MRSIIFAVFLAICCIVGYTNAAALPENPSEKTDFAAPEEFNDREDDPSELNDEENGNTSEAAQSRTLFLLLPLLFPDQFYFS